MSHKSETPGPDSRCCFQGHLYVYCKIFILNLTYVSVDSSSVYLFLHSPSLQLSTFAVVYVHIPMLSDSLCNGLGVSPSIRLPSNFAHAIIFRQKQLFLCNAWLPLSAVSWLMLDWCWLIYFLWLCNDFVPSVYVAV